MRYKLFFVQIIVDNPFFFSEELLIFVELDKKISDSGIKRVKQLEQKVKRNSTMMFDVINCK